MDLVLCLKIAPLPLGGSNVLYIEVFPQIGLDESVSGARSDLLLASCCS